MPFLEQPISASVTLRTMAEQIPEEVLARFEEIHMLEAEFEDVELELSKIVAQFLRTLNA
jgi:hypothetical protein